MEETIKQMNSEKEFYGEETKKRTLVHYIVLLILLLLLVYAVVMWISQRAKVDELTKQNEEIEAQIVLTQQQCDEYNRILSTDDQNAYMERIAIEKYGYGYPGEKRYYFTSKE